MNIEEYVAEQSAGFFEYLRSGCGSPRAPLTQPGIRTCGSRRYG
jgi:hypothetical protein